MRALRLTAAHRVELCTIARPDPGPGDVLVRIGAAGACHSDLHIIDAPVALGMPIPLTLGRRRAAPMLCSIASAPNRR